jgi:hypothetical protein
VSQAWLEIESIEGTDRDPWDVKGRMKGRSLGILVVAIWVLPARMERP